MTGTRDKDAAGGSSRGTTADRRAIVVSFVGEDPLRPRAQRATHLTTALERSGFQVEQVPPHAVGPFKRTVPRRVGRRALRPMVMDDYEIPARLTLRGWKPSAGGAVLIGWPFSPICLAAVRLVAAGIPYGVDAGDPWALTDPEGLPRWRFLSQRRAETAERFLWSHAAAGVVTTRTQASALQAHFPDLDLLIRPNGYSPADEPAVGRDGADPARADELRLIQFGSIIHYKLPIGEWLSRLRSAAGLTSVRFANYGVVGCPELLRTRDPGVVVEVHDPVEWGRACEIARDFDAAVVVANTNPAALPSKAIQYLTLPIPRIAVTADSGRGELAAFAAERPGFIPVGLDSPEDAPRVIRHARRPWSAEELSPPARDSWNEVAREVVEFAIEAWDRRRK
jgi:hypothetical protein